MNRAFENGLHYFRSRRMRRFAELFRVAENTTILDVGGTEYNWNLLPIRPRVVLLNMPRDAKPAANGMFVVAGDGRQLPFPDQSFDVVFSNSVIEHVGGAAGQESFARETARVGRRYWVQTPDRSFPVEPHLVTPFLHLLPAAQQAAIARHLTVWDLLSHPSPDQRAYYIRHFLEELHLLKAGEMRRLFPGARILHERLFGLSRSLIAFKF